MQAHQKDQGGGVRRSAFMEVYDALAFIATYEAGMFACGPSTIDWAAEFKYLQDHAQRVIAQFEEGG